MLTEEEAIRLYRDLFRSYPPLLELPEKDLMESCSQIYMILTGKNSTRDHIKIAVAQHTGNAVKRAWDLKQKYGILLFLKEPEVTRERVHSVLLSLFNQRTRPGVIISCQQAAIELSKEMSPAELEHWVTKVTAEFESKSKDPNILDNV